MSLIQDTTQLYLKRNFAEDSDKDNINPYYEGFLNRDCRLFKDGYDWCTKQAVKNFFYNLEMYAEMFAELGIDVSAVNAEAVCASAMDEAEVEMLNATTRLFGILYDCLINFIGIERDNWITSAIDGMNDKEYEQARAEFFLSKNAEPAD